ncbi:hypothetical protein [Flaviaesturariibacter amylovorans]|uniref:DUF3379 family protein n=1 Tax=Flaviaesturariibacter amylovorans TaxID=1084520 RepID=A0ABP8GC62_9BACT
MTERRHIAEELHGLGSTLPHGPTGIPYAVPEGFFDAFPGTLLARLHEVAATDDPKAELEGLSPLLAGLPKRMPFSVPEGFFGATPALPGAPELPALLSAHDRRMPYTVPGGYFESLPETLLEAVRPKAKVVPLGRRPWYRTAAAAAVVGLLAIGGWFYSGSGTGTTPDVAANPEAWVEKRLNSVPDQALEEFIETADPVHGADLARNEPRKAEVNSLLSDVSDQEMAAFLEQVPTDDEHLNAIN